MRTIAEALRSMLPAFETLGDEEISLTCAAGRYLASDFAAVLDSPPFDNSAMDGYAVRAADVAAASSDSPVRLPVTGESRAGGDMPTDLEPGTACRIFTGAPMPAGADAVVIQEDTKQDEESVHIFEPSTVGRHIRARGSDLRSGKTILRRGDRLWPGEIGLLASQNVARVRVYRQPRVALLSTGDELKALGDELAPGTIINSNVYVLSEMLSLLGAVPQPLPSSSDDLPSIEAALRKALEADV
ncbi:MAG: molybdopterin molybdotransferase MoeA, partial [Myxococcales bacterium]|nr:molybdopterin molybdotransferase MoeA [Myxococcales bacterium]